MSYGQPMSRSSHAIRSAVLVLLLGVCSCDGDDGPPGDRVCSPGIQIQCYCSDGSPGAQRCRGDGSGFSRCVCDGPADAAGDGEGDSGAVDVAQGDAASGDADRDLDGGLGDTLVDSASDGAAEPADDLPLEGDDGPEAVDAGADSEADAAELGDALDAAGAVRELGEDCTSASQCETDVCLGLTVAGSPASVCATPCCHEEECPDGFGCLQAGAGRYCLPSRIFPPEYTFTAPTGDDCGPADAACKSGICETTTEGDRCRGTCCTDNECLAAPCHWSLAGSSLRTFCDPAGLLGDGLHTGQPCSSELNCWSGVCAQNQAGGYQCADLCCGPADCGGGTVCGLVGGLGGSVVRACVDAPRGDAAEGTPCTSDGECASGNCIEDRCRRLCCLDADCASPERCLPRVYEGVLVPVCVDPATE